VGVVRKSMRLLPIKSTTAVAWRELELELIQTQMTQKPVLRVEVYARYVLHAYHVLYSQGPN